MSEFMEVFTVTHLTYVCIVPCFVAFFGMFFVAAGEILSFNVSNLFFCVFALIFILLSCGKVFKTMKRSPYFEIRMEQFKGEDQKLKSLSY